MDRHPRVLDIISGFGVESPLGGIERFTLELSFHLLEMGIPLSIYGLWQHGTPFEEQWLTRLQDKGARTFIGYPWEPEHPYRSFWQAYARMKQSLSGQKFDVIHCHGQFCDVAGILLKGMSRQSSLVRTVHHEYEWRKRPFRRAMLTHWVYPLCFDREIGVSQAVTTELDQRYAARIWQKKATFIPNGINIERFHPESSPSKEKPAGLYIPPDAFVIGSVGRMAPEKGYDDLLHAFREIADEVPSAIILLVGDGEYKQNLADLACELKIDDRVHFLGPRKDIEALLPVFNLFVSSSYWEAMPTVLLESMAARVPVIATRTTGAEALINDRVSGMLVPPRNPGMLARAVLDAYRHPQWLREWAAHAYQDVQAYSMDVVAKQHFSLYASLMRTERAH